MSTAQLGTLRGTAQSDRAELQARRGHVYWLGATNKGATRSPLRRCEIQHETCFQSSSTCMRQHIHMATCTERRPSYDRAFHAAACWTEFFPLFIRPMQINMHVHVSPVRYSFLAGSSTFPRCSIQVLPPLPSSSVSPQSGTTYVLFKPNAKPCRKKRPTTTY